MVFRSLTNIITHIPIVCLSNADSNIDLFCTGISFNNTSHISHIFMDIIE